MRQQPRDCQLEQPPSARLSVLYQTFYAIEVVFGQQAAVPIEFGDARSTGDRLTLSVLAGQESALERKKGQECHIEPIAFIQYSQLRLAMQQTVFVLYTDEAPRAPTSRSCTAPL